MINIYLIYYTDQPKHGYVGMTSKSLRKRLGDHLSESRFKNSKKNVWLRASNTELVKIKLLHTTCKDTGYRKEKYYIRKYKRLGWTLYNSNNGGGGILKHTRKTKNMISTIHKGKDVSLETKLKMSRSLKGKSKIPYTIERKLARTGINNKNSIPVIGIELTTGEEVEFSSSGTASRILGISRTSIIKCRNGVYKSAGNYKWY